METINKFVQSKLQNSADNFSLRALNSGTDLIDFCSNDYLGFANSPELRKLVTNHICREEVTFPIGATGSRLISGNDVFTETLEEEIALFHKAESALIFNSGYDANLGIFSSLPQRGDTIILDELIHASIIDGARLSYATRYSFKHNDLSSLEQKLQISKGKIYIGIESIYSMDGDEAPLDAITALAKKYSAALIVDEAHAIGIFGKNGRGLVEQYNVEDKVFARIVTFGKALGCHGAAVLCNLNTRQFLINFARSFVYTTAASYFTHLSVKMAYQHLITQQNTIHKKIELFKSEIGKTYSQFICSNSPIQSLLIPGNTRAKQIASALQAMGFNVRPILHPTVPVGKERLRICLHTFNTDNQISDLAKSIKDVL